MEGPKGRLRKDWGAPSPKHWEQTWLASWRDLGLYGSYDWLKPLVPNLPFSSGAPLKKITFFNTKTFKISKDSLTVAISTPST